MIKIKKMISNFKNRKFLKENLLCEVDVCKELTLAVLNEANYNEGSNEFERTVIIEPFHSNWHGNTKLYRIKRSINSAGVIYNMDKLMKHNIYVYTNGHPDFYYYYYTDKKGRPHHIITNSCPPSFTDMMDAYYRKFESKEILRKVIDECSENIKNFRVRDYEDLWRDDKGVLRQNKE